MNKIICQDVHSGSGCPTCGGYEYVLERSFCPTCDRDYWLRPGVFTAYDGKQFKSVDGVLITIHLDRPWTCHCCEALKVDEK